MKKDNTAKATSAENNNIFSEQFDIKSLEVKKPKSKKEPKQKKERNIQKLATAFIDNPSDENFRALAERINWGLRGYIYKIVNDDEATTEVMSKTLENIYFKRDQFDCNKAQFSTWMYRIAFNNSLKYIQAKNNSKTLNIDFSDLYDSTVANDGNECSQIDSCVTSEPLNIVYKGGEYVSYDKDRVLTEFYDASVKSIQELPDNLRVVMYDRLINQKKIDDIAYDNNIPVSSVKNWLRKGRTELQEIIKTQHPTLYSMYQEIAAC